MADVYLLLGSRCVSGQDAFCQGREAVLNMTVGHDSFHHLYPRPWISEVILLENLFDIYGNLLLLLHLLP